MAQASYRELAARARQEADVATLANVRERALRAEAAWLEMAARQDRNEQARIARAPADHDAAARTGTEQGESDGNAADTPAIPLR
ncbi:hypothetical protein GVO57_05770 [Sphingomonas changnyeongensis]|uniref:Uncharacterized protein n=1 Tax=Sphingomonas changnyeongensis TaxID=2698679 RepID=A0A7Z2S4U8_9SPHN|nr:hypothetical protein [Sphingomonas changnyeongensis]QHL90435.1 hypothetical protein GVO57_05770 [Sphingomonas changnyeongensis]